MKIKQVEWYYHLIDYLLVPFMYLIGSFKKDSLHHHHGYHSIKYKGYLDLSKCVNTIGIDNSKFTNIGGILSHKALFHFPILGGSKKIMLYL